MALCSGGGASVEEVIVPDCRYSANAVGAYFMGGTIVPMGVYSVTMLVEHDALEAVVMPFPVFVNLLNYIRLWEIQKRAGFVIIEDAVCSLGAS